jgi:predicted Zn-dependent protease
MNKTLVLLSAGLVIASGAFAQKDKLREAKKQLEKATTEYKGKPEAAEAFTKAKEAVDAATANAETSENAETWITRAGIYIGMQDIASLNANQPYREGITALKKAFQLNKKLEMDMNAVNMTANAAFFAFNDGINLYNNNKYGEAYKTLEESVALMGNDKDKRFMLIPSLDTIRAQAIMFKGFNAYYDADGNKVNEAITNLSLVQKPPYSNYLTKEHLANIYLVLAQSYAKQGNKEKQLAIIKEGRKLFPDDKNLNALDVNFALESGSQNDAIAKIEETIKAEPLNPELYMNLGILYNTLARPLDGAKKHENAKEYSIKAEEAYKKMVELAPDNATYQYQMGSFYFNQAADVITEMNNLGSSKEDDKKYNVLNKQKDILLNQALPNLEKSKDLFIKKNGKYKGDEPKTFFNCLQGLKEIYSRKDMNDKSAEVKTLMDKLNQ